MTIGELIEKLGGKLVRGSAELDLTGVNSPANARASELVFAEDDASAAEALKSSAGAVVLKAGTNAAFAARPSIAVIEADQPKLWFARAAKNAEAQDRMRMDSRDGDNWRRGDAGEWRDRGRACRDR